MTKNVISKEDVIRRTEDALSLFSPPALATVISQDSPLPIRSRNEVGPPPKYELFHYTISLCSQKVRSVLAETGCQYGSNDLIIMENWYHYRPEYVRLRLLSETARSTRQVSGYSGVSSVEQEGFDPLVVPTFVDRKAGLVIADSKQICIYIARMNRSESDLLPVDIEDDVIEQMNRVDLTPHVALLYGANPDGDSRPEGHQKRFPGIHARKISAIEKQLALVDTESELLEAYQSKILKETAAADFVHDAAAMRHAIGLAKDLIGDLGQTLLANGNGPWLFGERFTLADLFWGISLLRLEILGYAKLWCGHKELSHIEQYFNRLIDRESLQTSVLNWADGPASVAASIKK